jgi:membrane-associated protease RseP (regulator of RpoE activity)
MKYLLRQYRNASLAVVVLSAAIAVTPPGARAQGGGLTVFLQEPSPVILHASTTQGYLGVDIADIDQDKAQSLKLKEVRGALITLIDHDAPAGQIGLKVNDVIIQLNGQNVEGAEQLKRMLREIPAGRKVSLEFSRDGNVQTVAVELVDHRVLGHDIWNRIGNSGDVFAQSESGMGYLKGDGDVGVPGALRLSIFGSTLNVGALVEPLASQMAEYLGVSNGIMVKQVARKSEAAAAGLKIHDVVLKVGADPIANLADWDRALRANQGKPVQVTILRDRKQQTITLQVDSKHKGSKVEELNIFPDSDCPLVAEVDPAKSQELSRQAEALRDQLGSQNLQLDTKQVQDLQREIEKFRHDFNAQDFKAQDFQVDQKQLQDLQKQMEEFRKNFNPGDLRIDPKLEEDLEQKLDQLQNDSQPEPHQIAPY